VVTTPAVAAGIHAGEEVLLVGDDAGSIGAAAIGVLQSPERYADMVRRAREFVRDRFSWDLLERRLERVAGPASSAPGLVNA
jgi:glycosyltransferase involved in cell wall biosynthesis